MSRTKRTPVRKYYGRSAPPSEFDRRRESVVGSDHYRCRYYHGYDGGHRGHIRDVHRAGDKVAYGYGERGRGQDGRAFSKARAARMERRIAKHTLRDQLGDPDPQAAFFQYMS